MMKNPKIANIVYRQMPTPRELLQQGVVIYEIDTCITWLSCILVVFVHNFWNRNPNHKVYQQKLNPKCIG